MFFCRVPRNRRDAKDDIEGSGEDDFYDYENEEYERRIVHLCVFFNNIFLNPILK